MKFDEYNAMETRHENDARVWYNTVHENTR